MPCLELLMLVISFFLNNVSFIMGVVTQDPCKYGNKMCNTERVLI